MRTILKLAIPMIVTLTLFLAVSAGVAVAQDASLMTKEALNKILTDDDVLILDARRGRDWSASEFKIQGAVRADPDDVEKWAGSYAKNKKIVIYCA